MKLRVAQSGIYNDQFNKASYREVGEVFETLPAYGMSLIKSGYVIPTVDEVFVDIGDDVPVDIGDNIPVNVGTITEAFDESTFIDELVEASLPHRAALALFSVGYRSRESLSLASDDDLLTITWVGEGTLEKIREFVKKGDRNE